MSYLGDKDFYLEVAKGLVSGHSILNALGERESIGTTATGEDIWRGNELAPAPTSATVIPTPSAAGEQMTVVSESVNDTSAGTGVQTLRVHYLDASGNEQSTDVTMNGTTGVDLTPSDVRFVQDMYTLTAGSNGVAEDHIKIYRKTDTGLVYNMIAQGGNRSLVPHRMVPNAKKLYLKAWHATEGAAKRCAFRIRSTDMNGTLISGVFCFKDTVYLSQSSSGDIEMNIQIPALSIVKVSGWATAINAEGSCGWWGVLVDD